MKISVLTLFPKMISGFFEESIVKRAQEKKLVEINLVNIRKFAIDDYGTVDDRPYGGGAGMILRADVIWNSLNKLKIKNEKIKIRKILTSPKGKVFNQQKAQEFSRLENLVIIAGHYEDVDERVREFVDEEVSMGDFVTTGGEIAASSIVDSVVRLLPSVLKKEDAITKESFSVHSINRLDQLFPNHEIVKKLKLKGVREVELLEYPQYTRPEKFRGKKVPEILVSGDHKKIEEWRLKKAFEETLKKRPDLLK